MKHRTPLPFKTLKGLVLTKVVKEGSLGYFDNEGLRMTTEDGREFFLVHSQTCCESVYIEDICGDLEDLIGSPILEAAEEYNDAEDSLEVKDYHCSSATWSFYKLGTIKGSVTIRFYGSSNGYYCEVANLWEYQETD